MYGQCVVLVALMAVGYGVQDQSNYEISRNKLGSEPSERGFTFKDIAEYFLGYGQYSPNYDYGGQHYPSTYPGNQGHYQGQYPSNQGQYPSNQGQYPGQYPSNQGHYPGQRPGLPGPPGAHPGCPLCDSSVYSYCSYKQAHDSCCCDHSPFTPLSCRMANCKFLYSNSCQEYNLISSCCCVDVNRAVAVPVVPVPVLG